ncbi:MAG TPA: sulfatase-like hydrolase/transferase [Thermoanaerobaculia bacterium]|nr:sulfatase-like hydrolase/transferase [Thermoanaerobaculia bacterium]
MTARPRSALSRILLAGLTAGVLLGIALGARAVAINRYLADGYPQLALEIFRSFLNRYAAGVVLCFLLIEITFFLLALILSRRGRKAHGLNAAFWVLVATGAVLWAFLRAPWLPDVRTGRGFLIFSAVLAAGAFACRFVARHEELARRGGDAVLRGLGHRGSVAAALVLLAAFNAGAAAVEHRAPQSRLNVLLITIDTLRADHLSAYGYPRSTSPNIDRLAREGVLFHRAISQWPKTSPSFASMMSSTYGHTNGLIRTTAQRMPDRFLMLAELLKAGGYSTRAAVANPNLGRLFNFDQGFETYLEPWREADERRRSDLVTREGLDLLRQGADEKRPFFVWLHYFDPHARYQPSKPYDGMFVNDAHFDASWRMPLQQEQRKDIGGIPTTASLGNENRIAYYVAQYDAEIREVDQQVGILLQALEKQGLARNTLVVLTSDHGESLGEHNYFFEHGRFPYDDCVHVPLLVRAPGTSKPGHVVLSPVELIDLVPTVLDLAGLPPDREAEGKSFRRLLEGEPNGGSRWQYAFSESGYGEDYQRSVTSERFKLVYVPDTDDQQVMKGRELELYDLQQDPGETRNLIDEQPEVAAPLRAQLSRWMAGGTTAEAPREVHIDSVAASQLRSLGYL